MADTTDAGGPPTGRGSRRGTAGNYVWSLLEKVAQRGISGLLTLSLAALASPGEVGYYSVAITVLTLLLMVTEQSLRQVGSVAAPEDMPAFARAVRTSPTYTVPTMVVALVLLLTDGASLVTVLGLAPLCLAPLFASWYGATLVHLQRQKNFKTIARAQVGAAALSLVASVPILLTVHSILGPSVQFALSELLTWVFLRRWADRGYAAGKLSERGFWRRARPTVVLNVSAWAQTQGDRLFMLVFSSADIVGQYSIANTVARLLTDVIGTSLTNVARPLLAEAPDDVAFRRTSRGIFAACGLMVLTGSAGLVLAGIPVLRYLLPDTWDPALDVIPIFVVGTALSSFAWLVSVVLLAKEALHPAIVAQTVGSFLAVGIGVAGAHGIRAAAFAFLAREVVLLPYRVWSVHREVGREPILVWSACIAAVTCLAFVGG